MITKIAQLVKVGNSQFLLIPKPWLVLLGNPTEFTLRIEAEKLVITPVTAPAGEKNFEIQPPAAGDGASNKETT